MECWWPSCSCSKVLLLNSASDSQLFRVIFALAKTSFLKTAHFTLPVFLDLFWKI